MCSIYDTNRDAELNNFGLKVVRFSNNDVINNIENTLKTIEQEILNRINQI